MVDNKKNIVWLSDVSKKDISLVGGKGANLGEMLSKFPIPNGFCVSVNAYDYFLEKNDLKETVFKLLKKIDVDDTKKLESIAEKIRKTILAKELPADLVFEIKKNYALLENKKVAVRSSATAEDLPTASFAGQQDTYLNISGDKAVIEAVRKCFASLFTARAIYYRAKNNFDHEDVKLCVVIQEMVDAKYAGVMFTLDPIHKKYSLVEAVKGLGEKLVSGQVTPNTYFLDKKSLAVNQKNIVFDMDEKIIQQVARMGEDIQKHYKAPMDVEWVIDKKGRLLIVQARPITT